METVFEARRLDVRAFAQQGATLSGQGRADQWHRLRVETSGHGADQPVTWSAAGELRNQRHSQPQVWLHLQAQATLSMTCLRCLAPLETAIVVARWFRFVTDEQTAAAEDEKAQEDVLVLSRDFDLIGLVEDELLMAIPVAPRHELCPEPVKLAVADAGFEAALRQRESPFAALGKVKTGKP